MEHCEKMIAEVCSEGEQILAYNAVLEAFVRRQEKSRRDVLHLLACNDGDVWKDYREHKDSLDTVRVESDSEEDTWGVMLEFIYDNGETYKLEYDGYSYMEPAYE
ncbi:hypothetical protein [Vibrio phage RYC]|nr:hypothetical protein [Vibrio phage RYC]